jgi:Domain of unknown function (DUF4365)
MSRLLASTDIEEAVSCAYAHAVAAAAGMVVALRHFDRDGIDITFKTGGDQRPKLDAQLKATINLTKNAAGLYRFPCPRKNYDLLRIPTQVPRILILLHLPRDQSEWVKCTPQNLILRNCVDFGSARPLRPVFYVSNASGGRRDRPLHRHRMPPPS